VGAIHRSDEVLLRVEEWGISSNGNFSNMHFWDTRFMEGYKKNTEKDGILISPLLKRFHELVLLQIDLFSVPDRTDRYGMVDNFGIRTILLLLTASSHFVVSDSFFSFSLFCCSFSEKIWQNRTHLLMPILFCKQNH
jgi:hypothetical protein